MGASEIDSTPPRRFTMSRQRAPPFRYAPVKRIRDSKLATFTVVPARPTTSKASYTFAE